jgi:hypothetical protein
MNNATSVFCSEIVSSIEGSFRLKYYTKRQMPVKGILEQNHMHWSLLI